MPQIIIIGAGFAGLAAHRALRLSKHALDVILLEGSSRVGGRAHTIQLDACGAAELGATWLHGLKGHPVYELALERGLMDGTEKHRARRQWGLSQYVREGAPEPLTQQETEAAAAAARAYADAVEEAQEPAHAGNPAANIGQYLRQQWAEMGRGGQDWQLWAEAWRWRERLQRAIDGCASTDDMGAAGMAEYYELPGPNIPVTPGYSRMAEILAEGADIRYGHTVSSIRWGSDGVRLECSNGQAFHADAVIVTVSLGVLKAEHATLFQPPLPAVKADLIAKLGMGIVDKIFITFHGMRTGAHLRRSVLSYQLLWKADASEWEPAGRTTEGAPSNHGSTHAEDAPQWIRGAYSLRLWGPEFLAPKERMSPSRADAPSNGRFYPEQRNGLLVAESHAAAEGGGGGSGRAATADAAVPAAPLPAPGSTEGEEQGTSDVCAVLWITGQDAVDMEAASDKEVRQGISAILDAFPALDLPRSFSVSRSRWGADPLCRGSYSYVTPGTCGDDIEALAAPLEAPAAAREGQTRPVVLFAGEHTHRSHFGTVHGAYFSGEREAARILANICANSDAREENQQNATA